MRTWSPAGALGVVLATAALVGAPIRAGASGDVDPIDARAVVLTDLGVAWRVVDESVGAGGVFTRTFASIDGVLMVQAIAAPDPPGVRAVFDGAFDRVGLDARIEPSLGLAVWLSAPGRAPGDDGTSTLTFAARRHVFTVTMFTADGTAADGPALVLAVARRQIDAAGGPPPEDVPAASREVDDRDLLRYLPASPPTGSGTWPAQQTVVGPDPSELAAATGNEVAEFLVRRSTTVARAWARPDLAAAVWITEYPYDVVAASVLHFQRAAPSSTDADQVGAIPNAVISRQADQVGVAFRRGDIVADVIVRYRSPIDETTAVALAVEMAGLTADLLPTGATAPYDPSPPSRFVGLGLTALIVAGAVAGSRTIALLRVRRIRRRWAADEPLPAPPPPGTPALRTIELDADAAALRRRGWTLVGIQLLAVEIGVVAVAGDFANPGLVVGALSLVTGLAVTRWWVGRELSLLGARAPARVFVLPRLPGVLLGVVTFAVLGLGTAFLLKGVRYLVLPPTLAQLRWTDLLGISPRAVGVTFAIGGLAVAALGAAMYRAARAWSRAGARRLLAADSRPPALYLRSFADDSVPLPTIASARRPFFELFSVRGADPFEESVAWELHSYAPVVAVGRPGGSVRSLGAARELLPHETWRAEVAERMRTAALIVLAPGETSGVAWELAEIVRGGHLAKTAFVFPPLAPSVLRRRWEHTTALLDEAGATIGPITAPASSVHTVRVESDGSVVATVASTRDEATYRTAVDRTFEPRSSAAGDTNDVDNVVNI